MNDFRCNPPAAPEVAMILLDHPHQTKMGLSLNRNIVLHRRTQPGGPKLQWINELHAAYQPLQYLLLFP